jgi:hypothetical protein
MEYRMMEQDTPIEHVVEYLVASLAKLSKGLGIGMDSAYEYTRKYGGLAYLMEGYEIEHQFSLEDAAEHMLEVCQRNGGEIDATLPRF